MDISIKTLKPFTLLKNQDQWLPLLACLFIALLHDDCSHGDVANDDMEDDDVVNDDMEDDDVANDDIAC